MASLSYKSTVCLVILLSLSDYIIATCPDTCICNAGKTIVTCSPTTSDDVNILPNGLPSTIEQLELHNQNGLEYSFGNIAATFLSSIPSANLKKLKLFKCGITKIEKQTFAAFTALRELYLNENQLTEFEFLKTNLNSLDILSLSDQIIQAGDTFQLNSGHFSSLPALKTLKLEGLHLSELPTEVLSHLPAITDLHLTNNKLSSLGLSKFTAQNGQKILTNLKKLFISRNKLVALPVGLNKILSNLILIDLGYNHISNFTREFYAGYEKLESLYLNSNNIPELPVPSFIGSELPMLKTLNLDATLISTIPPRAFQLVASLQSFVMQAKLTEFPIDFGKEVPNLEELILHSNKITELQEKDLRYFSKLKKLDLSYNEIKSVDESLRPKLESIGEVLLHSNPFHCNCELSWFYSYLHQHFNQTKHLQYRCKTGSSNITGSSILDQKSNVNFICIPPTVNRIITHGNFKAFGGMVSIECIVGGDPHPSVRLYTPTEQRNLHTLTNENSAEQSFKYTIHNYTSEDLGTYICSAIQGDKTANSTIVFIHPSDVTLTPFVTPITPFITPSQTPKSSIILTQTVRSTTPNPQVTFGNLGQFSSSSRLHQQGRITLIGSISYYLVKYYLW